jgi:hypothetical protein
VKLEDRVKVGAGYEVSLPTEQLGSDHAGAQRDGADIASSSNSLCGSFQANRSVEVSEKAVTSSSEGLAQLRFPDLAMISPLLMPGSWDSCSSPQRGYFVQPLQSKPLVMYSRVPPLPLLPLESHFWNRNISSSLGVGGAEFHHPVRLWEFSGPEESSMNLSRTSMIF